jgi:hypothetical protein
MNNKQNRIIIYTTESISGVPNGDWEEGDTLEQAQEKTISILEDMGKNPNQIKTILSFYKQTSTQTMITMPSTEWNDFYAICIDCRGRNWVSDKVFNLILKQAMILNNGKDFKMPEIQEYEVAKEEYTTPIAQIAYRTITDEEIDAILNEPSPALVSERG